MLAKMVEGGGMLRILSLSMLLLLLSTPCFAEQPQLWSESFGFDWLQPDSAQCVRITESMRARFSDCTLQDGAFGLNDSVFSCPVSEHSCYLVFESMDVCIENLETMQANAP